MTMFKYLIKLDSEEPVKTNKQKKKKKKVLRYKEETATRVSALKYHISMTGLTYYSKL